MEQSGIEDCISADKSRNMIIGGSDDRVAKICAVEEGGDTDKNKNSNDVSNDNEELRLDYDGVSDENCNDTTIGSEKKMENDCNEIINSSEEEIRLDYDGVSDENCNDTTNGSEKMVDGCNITTNDNEDEIRLDYDGVSDDNCEDTNIKNEGKDNGNNTSNIDEEKISSVHKRKGILDSDDDDEDKNSEPHIDDEEITNVDRDEITDEKVHGRSTQKGKQTLQSQQQRLQREAQFSIPYHKPKKYTLQEFLSRRTIMKPSKSVEEKSCLESLAKYRNLKMTKEELEIYSYTLSKIYRKLMEARAKEASEFFKPENVENLHETSSNESSDITTKNDKENMLICKGSEQPKSTKVNERQESEERGTSSNVIITEVLELPKLDLANVAADFNLQEIIKQSLSPKAKTVFSLASVKKGISPDMLKNSPILKDDNMDITVDVFTNEKISPTSINRANSLLDRLMKTNSSRKLKCDTNVGLLSPNSTPKSPLMEKGESSLNKKPGETFLKLKDNLKSLIMKKRREELIKKQEEDDDKKKEHDDGELTDELDDEEFDEEATSEENSDLEHADKNESAKELDYEIEEESQKIPAAQMELASDMEERIRLSFAETEEELQNLGTPTISQIPATQLANEEDTDQLINLCSGTFETQPVTVNKAEMLNSYKIISSDEEYSPLSNNKNSRNKKYTKKVKKSKMKLGFSDDEDDEDDEVDNKSDKSDKSVQNEVVGSDNEDVLQDDNMPATYIDYDSEENEITVELTKQEFLKRAENFVEKEAELSDSEWGSADEDEKNLDQYDIELGDEDEFDKEEVRAELEKIHARKMLDEDIRQVNKLQEILFEDEEDPSAQRQRKFRWKNFDAAFNLDISQNQLNDIKLADGSDDDENEHLWRRIRFEREQAIKNNSLDEITLEASTSISTPKSSSELKNVTIVNTLKTNKISGAEEKEISPFLISKELIKCENIKARSSFLLRNKKTLTKTICAVKNGGSDVNTSEDKIGVKAINPSKFVFTTLTVEEHETLKRKADDINGGIDIKISKRLKGETRKSEYLIDKLL